MRVRETPRRRALGAEMRGVALSAHAEGGRWGTREMTGGELALICSGLPAQLSELEYCQ